MNAIARLYVTNHRHTNVANWFLFNVHARGQRLVEPLCVTNHWHTNAADWFLFNAHARGQRLFEP